MNQEEIRCLLALRLIAGIGPVTAQNLIAYCGQPSRVFSLPAGKLMRIPEVGAKTVTLLRDREVFRMADQEIEWCARENIHVLPYTSPDYPALLKQIPDLPLVLFAKGNTPLPTIPWVAVVGTRMPDEYGRQLAREISTGLTEAGAGVLSGLAFGIDAEAHRACLKAGGITAGVLGHGLHTIYPWQHHSLADKILENGGVLMTEYVSGTKPDAVNFPNRNRIVAGMCRAVVVVQAAKTGGALITARLAFDYDREVFAIPGDLGRKASEGCNHLIQDQYARIFSSIQDIVDLLKIQERQGIPAMSASHAQENGLLLSVEEKKLLQTVENGTSLLDDLMLQGEWTMARLQGLLLAMEVKGLLKIMPGRRIVLQTRRNRLLE